MKDLILIVDDIQINRVILREILERDYRIVEAATGTQAIELLFGPPPRPQAVLLDIVMPDMDGFEVLEMIKANPDTEKIPVLFITGADAVTNEFKGLKQGAVDYISKPFDPDVVKARLDNHIQLSHYHTHLEEMVRGKTEELTRTHDQMLQALATIIEYRNLESGVHVRRSVDLVRILVNRMLLHPVFGRALVAQDHLSMIKAAALHDVGKIGIPDNILLKPGRLTPEEFEVVKGHAVIGSRIIESIWSQSAIGGAYLLHCRDICRSHHERWDGRGYPDGIAGKSIPLSARIMAVVDVYDALTHQRCYKEAYTHQEAMQLIRQGRGTQFDPDILDTLETVQRDFQRVETDAQHATVATGA